MQRTGFLILLALLPPGLFAQVHSDHRNDFPNFDRRSAAVSSGASDVSFRTAGSPAAQAALSSLEARVGAIRIDRDPLMGSPAFIASTRGFLTGPAGAGLAMLGSALDAIPASDPHRAAKGFVDSYPSLFGHRSDVLAAAKVNRDYVTAHNGLRTTIWQQQLDGISVFEAVFQAHVTSRGELVNVASKLVPNLEQAAQRGAPNRAARLAAPAVSAAKAVAIAGRGIGESLSDPDVTATDAAQGNDALQHFRAPTLLGAEARFVWLPMNADTLRLCWEVVCTGKSTSYLYRLLVDAETGDVVVRQCLTNDIAPASYRVFTSDSPSPFSPGLASPGTFQPPLVSRTLVTLSALDTTASPNGWINDGIVETRGNNVDAHTDLNADNVADLPRPQATGPNRVFDPPLDLTLEPSTYRNAAVVQLFYLCNWMHDRLYQVGFTEAAGNFQNDNFGRGGFGNDAVQADAQDGSGTNNANFSTPSDGSPGRMQMYIFTGSTPDRDGDFDAEVVLHEYTHGLSHRLVGGGVGISALQSAGMGEGWSDFYAMCLLAEPGDNLAGNYPTGGYVTLDYYAGIRRYPYSTNLAKNPLTFKDIDPSQAVAPGTAAEVHNQGEVWCVTLWEVRVNLVTKHGFATGNQLTLQLITDGMKLAPANPNMLQARDAIVQADLVLTGGANRLEIWSGFAKRGMGAGAYSPGSSTTTGVLENFDLPDDLAITTTAPLFISGVVGGPFTPASTNYTLKNNGTASLNWTATKSVAWLNVSPASGTLAPGATTTIAVATNSSTNALGDGTYRTNVTFTNTTNGVIQTRSVQLLVDPVTTPLFTETFESGTLDPTKWTVSGTSTFRTQITTANSPHGGTRHLTMDSTTQLSYARNEATLTLNLAGEKGIRLRFWAKGYGEDADGPPASPFANGADFDGVAISADGTNWYEVQGLRDTSTPELSNAWTRFTVDLDALMIAKGLSFNSTFKIRFNQFDNYPISTDGIAFDDIEVLRIVGAGAPVISTPPANQVANIGDTVTFSVAASGIPSPTYQWKFDGVSIAGATDSSLTITNAQVANVGSYTVTVTNMFGSLTSTGVTISGSAPAPTITQAPVNTLVTAGQTASFTVGATGSGPLSYQWRRHGFLIAGATNASLSLPNSSRTDADYYDVMVGAGLSVTASSRVRLSVAPTAYPATIAPDPAWDVQPDFGGGTGYVVVPVADGRAYLAGSFITMNGSRRTGVARINANGTFDSTFIPPEIDNSVRALAVQSDGRILIGGDFTRINGVMRNRIARLNTDGSFDSTFAPGSGASSTVYALAVQSDGRILVGGAFFSFNGSSVSPLVRLNADGSRDTTYAPGLNDWVLALTLQADGRPIIGGWFTVLNGTTRNRVARLNTDGTVDATFVSTGLNNVVNALALQSDGKVVVGGSFTAFSSTTLTRIARLNSDGSLDATFATNTGTGFNSTVNAVAVQSDGKVLVGGFFSTFNGASAFEYARLNSDGTRDNGLLTLGFTSSVYAIAIEASGKAIVGGSFSSYYNAGGTATTSRQRFARLNGDGSLDNSVVLTTRAAGSIQGTLLLPGGKTLVTGFFTAMRGTTVPTSVARINADGTVDTTFNPGGFGANSNVYAAARQPDGKIIITGFLSTYNGATAQGIARLNSDGTLDPGFSPAGGFSPGYALAILPGGRVAVGGSFTTVNGVARNRIAVLGPDGSLDRSFDPGTGASSTVYALATQPDGKLLVGGGFSTFNGSTAGRIARLNINGSLDTSFTSGSGANSTVYAMAVLPDGKILIGGAFTSFSGTTRSGVARLNSNGSLDTTFVPPTVGSVYSLIAQEDGRVVVRGAFTSVGGATSGAYLARLNADGTRDTSFVTGGFTTASFTPEVATMRDGGQMVFHTSSIAGLNSTQPATAPVISAQPLSQVASTGGSVTFTVAASGSALALSYQWSFNGGAISGATNASFTINNVQASHAGNYTVVVTSELGSATSNTAVLTTDSSSRLLAGSARSNVGIGPAAVLGAFTVEGTTPKQMLVRGIGPTLSSFGIVGVLVDPQLEIVNATTGVVVATNDDWGSAANAGDIAAATTRVGAFALPSGSKDAVVLATFAPGTYRLRIVGAGSTTGIAMAEVYDADTTLRLVYVATRAQAGPGSNTLVASFVASGTATSQYLIRAVGSSSLFSAGMIGNPVLSVYSGSTLIATNDDWGNDASSPTIAAATLTAGAQPLMGNSQDSVLLLTLSPGGYTAQVTSVATGLAVLEVFVIDANRASSFAPAIVSPPTPMTVIAGQSAYFGVAAVGKPTPSYQWRKDGANLSGATGRFIIISSPQISDTGSYDVIVTNSAGSATSASANLTVTSTASYSGTQAVVGPGFTPGGTVSITNILTFSGTASSLGWSATLPAGWSFASSSGSDGNVKPTAGDTGTIGWAWSTIPTSPVTFTYTLNVPASETIARTITASAIVRLIDSSLPTVTMTPNPLTVNRLTSHSADTNQDSFISLLELTRVIELYNTRNGSARTGCYSVATTTTEDGFSPDPSRLLSSVVTLARYHSGDSNHDGNIGLLELTRVIELYNYRTGTTRTGQYHVQAGTEDGFAPGP
jgi:uncharacterized delta-60 repeat protein